MLQLILSALTVFFESVKSVSGVVEKALPTPEMSQQIYNDKRAQLTEKERRKELRKSHLHLVFSPRETITGYVNLIYGKSLAPEDCLLLIKELHDMLPKHKLA